MRFIATLILATILTGAVAADDQKIDLSAMTCGQFVQGDPAITNLILTWFLGFYSEAQDPQVIDVSKLESTRNALLGFCKQQPDFKISVAAEGLFDK